jgi:hypothetical protein
MKITPLDKEARGFQTNLTKKTPKHKNFSCSKNIIINSNTSFCGFSVRMSRSPFEGGLTSPCNEYTTRTTNDQPPLLLSTHFGARTHCLLLLSCFVSVSAGECPNSDERTFTTIICFTNVLPKQKSEGKRRSSSNAHIAYELFLNLCAVCSYN